jgi:hypothetical protein
MESLSYFCLLLQGDFRMNVAGLTFNIIKSKTQKKSPLQWTYIIVEGVYYE